DPIDPAELIEVAAAAFRAQRMDGAAVLELSLEPSLPEVVGDLEALSAALLNLLQNAYKYSGEEKRIRLAARTERRKVAIDVVDNGMGIATRERRRIFDRFYRVDSLLTRRNEGSGLGLSIARRIVEAHGGTISLESHPGQGSTFTIHLPIAQRRKGRNRVQEGAET